MKTKRELLEDELADAQVKLLEIQQSLVELDTPPPPSPEEAFSFIMQELLDREPEYLPDFTSNDPKWIPVYDFQSDTFNLKSSIKQLNAPAHWYWPREAWEYIIRTYPQELRIAYGVIR